MVDFNQIRRLFITSVKAVQIMHDFKNEYFKYDNNVSENANKLKFIEMIDTYQLWNVIKEFMNKAYSYCENISSGNDKKFELTTQTLKWQDRILYRIVALKDFSDVHAGELGGWVESEDNLSQFNDAWIYGNSKVFGKARIYNNSTVHDDAQIFDSAMIFGAASVFDSAIVCGKAKVYQNAIIKGNATVFGESEVFGKAVISDNAEIEHTTDYVVFKNKLCPGKFMTWTKSNDKWWLGMLKHSLNMTNEEMVTAAFKAGVGVGKYYESCISFVDKLKTTFPFKKTIKK